MSSGIRAELSFGDAESCRVAQLTGRAGVETESISRSVAPESGRVTEEFAVSGNGDIDAPDLEEVFSYGSQSIYRFTRDQGEACPCEAVEDFGSPVVDVSAADGDLELALHVDDMAELQDVLGNVRAQFPNVNVDRLVRSPEGAGADLVLVDRAELTDRQREVLETAHRMGYFSHPKGANAGEVAEELGITSSTFTEHLAAAQSKLLSAILG